jgi:hypothetical protein
MQLREHGWRSCTARCISGQATGKAGARGAGDSMPDEWRVLNVVGL